ncbi:MAG: hypothetical protein INR69_10070 [Mucilaginibacter polytrichastri]|nr:hypothetical protein [Mucilaginibacter polytrichastri]
MRRSGRALLALLFTAAVLGGCKKDKTTAPDPDETGPTTGTAVELVKDSIYYYAKETYLWSKNLPAYSVFNPRGFTGNSDGNAFFSEVLGIAKYSDNKYDLYNNTESTNDTKYSFIDGGDVSSSLGGTGSNFGFSIIYAGDDDIRVRYVYEGSPAGTAGLKRGYQITKINNRTGSALTYDAESGGSNLNAISNALSQGQIILTLKKQDGTFFDVTLNTRSYTIRPVMASKVVTYGTHKIGYFCYASFTEMDNSKAALDQVFSSFAAAGITDLVVDLRYNGGGSVTTSEYIANSIAPASNAGKLMHTTNWAQSLQSSPIPFIAAYFKGKVEKDQQFTATNASFKPENNRMNFRDPELSQNIPTVNLSQLQGKVIFLVTGSTASASELLINNLIPYMNVEIVGRTTYGKPVGFFPIHVWTAPSNYYDLYLASFQSLNSRGQGDFYTGMVPGSSTYAGKNVRDDVSRDFGDPQEAYFAQAISRITTGQYITTTAISKQASVRGAVKSDVDYERMDKANDRIEQKLHPFNGMVLDGSLKRLNKN